MFHVISLQSRYIEDLGDVILKTSIEINLEKKVIQMILIASSD